MHRIAAAVETGDNGQRSVSRGNGCNARIFWSAPVLRPVPNVQDFNSFFGGTVHNNVRRADKLTGPSHLSGSSEAGEYRQLLDPVSYRLSDFPRGKGIV